MRRRSLALTALALAALVPTLSPSPAAAEPPAKELFGTLAAPSAAPPRAVGDYARGCLEGAVPLAMDGIGFQAMRPSRNRHWGHPRLIAFVEDLAAALAADGHPGLLVGDMAQPRGGPMRTGHRSHQTGLDVDIWFKPAPTTALARDARETLSALSLLQPGTRLLDTGRFEAFDTLRVVRTAASRPEVARVFVHPAIKRGLCTAAGEDRDWLTKVRPWWGHHYHFHVRLACPEGSSDCVDQEPPPAGDGCGTTLAWWFTDEPWQPSTATPRPPLRLDQLPPRCARLIATE